MKLDDYLTGIRNCSDKELGYEFGISPIMVIYLLSNLDEIESNLASFNKVKLTEKNSDELFFDYVPGSVDLKVTRGLSSYGLTSDFNLSNDDAEFYRTHLSEFNMSIILYPYQKKVMHDVSQRRAIANALEDLCNLAKSKGISICLPNSIGFNYLKPQKDLSRMVFYSPSTLLH